MVLDVPTAPNTDRAFPKGAGRTSLLDGVMEASAFAAAQKQAVRGSLVEDSLRSEEIRLAWQECTSTLIESTPAQQKECAAGVATLRSEFLAAYADVPDADDQTVLATVFYINLKSQWIVLNIWSGYRIASGKPDELLMCRLGMVSALLDALEKALAPDDVSVITEFLAHPVSRPLPTGEFLEPLPQKDAVSLPALSHHNSRKLREMRELIASQEAEMASHREADAHLVRALGTADPAVLVARFHEAQSQLSALKDLQEMLGGVETSMNFVNS